MVMMILPAADAVSRLNFLLHFPAETGRPWPPCQQTDLWSSGSRASGDFVEGRVGHLIGLHLRRPLYHRLERLEHTWIRGAGIRLRVFFQIPQTDADRVTSAGGDQRDFVLEALLLPKGGNDVLGEELGERRRVTRLEMERNTASKHVNLPGLACHHGKSDNLI